MNVKIEPLNGDLNLMLTATNYDDTIALEEIRQVLAEHPTAFNAQTVPLKPRVKMLEITIKKTQF